jgi:hypothetical protein
MQGIHREPDRDVRRLRVMPSDELLALLSIVGDRPGSWEVDRHGPAGSSHYGLDVEQNGDMTRLRLRRAAGATRDDGDEAERDDR